MSAKRADFRSLPSVDKILGLAAPLVESYGHEMVVDAIRLEIDAARQSILKGRDAPAESELVENTRSRLERWTRPGLRPVINATGVIIHTNLGRAPLSSAAIQAMEAVAAGYSNLEYDLDKGKRGSRYNHAEDLIIRLTGAEAALVVNNNAAAVLLTLRALANRRRVLISRTQLVEIGGGFRIPDVMKQSGALLAEIGATNKVHLDDYAQAIESQPIALVLSAHQSNFKLVGFTAEPQREELAELAHRYGLPYVEDLGSGTLLDTEPFGLGKEPTVQESLAAGVDLVTFSGDKLLGGPQAGIIAGKAELVAKLKKNPLARAVRADKTTYAALSATLLHYARGEALREVPVWRMISADPSGLKARAERWADQIRAAMPKDSVLVTETTSTVGGGSLPGQTLPTTALALRVQSAKNFTAGLRALDPPIISRVQDDLVLFDPRTVLPEQDSNLIENLKMQTGNL